MTVKDILQLLEGEVLLGEDNLDTEVHTACGSDMMSDVLAFVKDQSVLLTGLCNPQVIRTAEMMDIVCIVFVRGKKPDQEALALARGRDLSIITTKYSLFEACGRLYAEGLTGGSRIG
ncbi:MAG: DRTGG domain-containing protein [Lachnospiraceae bacterium]